MQKGEAKSELGIDGESKHQGWEIQNQLHSVVVAARPGSEADSSEDFLCFRVKKDNLIPHECPTGL